MEALKKEIENLRAENRALKDALECSGLAVHALPGHRLSPHTPSRMSRHPAHQSVRPGVEVRART